MARLRFALVFTCALTALSAHAITFYQAYGGDTGSNALNRIDGSTGTVVTVGNIGYAITGLAYQSSTGVMYAVTTPNSDNCAKCLITVDTLTGAGTQVGSLGSGGPVVDISFNGNTLYGWRKTGGTGQLVSINLATGAATTIGPAGPETDGGGNAFAGGTFYVFPNGDGGHVYSVNTTTGVATQGPSLSGAACGECSIAAATTGSDGQIYVLLYNPQSQPEGTHRAATSAVAHTSVFPATPGYIATINPATGQINVVTGTSADSADAFEAGPDPLPTASQWTLGALALALTGFAFLRLRS